MRNFFEGKKTWGHVSGILVKPKNTLDGYALLIDVWEANNVYIHGLIYLLSIS